MDITVKVERLSKSYNGTPAVMELCLEIRRGEVFGLLGPNGAGKTTAIECLLGARRPDEGTVSILGMDPVAERKRLFEQVGVQFQEGSFQDRITVEELCGETQCLYRSFTDYRELLPLFGLSDKAKSPVSELSGGQRQRLFIVLALIPDPQVVFLDELTTGLDTRARRDVWKCLERLKEKGLTIVLISHFMDEVEALCGRIGILREGKLIFLGTVEEAVKASPYDRLEEAYLWYTDEEGYGHESV